MLDSKLTATQTHSTAGGAGGAAAQTASSVSTTQEVNFATDTASEENGREGRSE